MYVGYIPSIRHVLSGFTSWRRFTPPPPPFFRLQLISSIFICYLIAFERVRSLSYWCDPLSPRYPPAVEPVVRSWISFPLATRWVKSYRNYWLSCRVFVSPKNRCAFCCKMNEELGADKEWRFLYCLWRSFRISRSRSAILCRCWSIIFIGALSKIGEQNSTKMPNKNTRCS